MREEEIMQITPALWGWYTYGQGEQGWGANRAPGVSGGKHGRQRGLAPARCARRASRGLHNESRKPKRRPYYSLEQDARSKGINAWTDQEIQDEEDWDSLVCDRVEASGLHGIFLMADIIRDWEATGDWDSYPGAEYGVRSTGFSPVCGLLGGRVVLNGEMYVH